MRRNSFHITAHWDDEAKVFYSESDIEGLHIEAATLEEFEEVILDTAVELVLANHVNPNDLATKPLKDVLPAILWQKAPGHAASA